MKAWISWTAVGGVLVASGAAVYGCGVGSAGTCEDNGTCVLPEGGDDVTAGDDAGDGGASADGSDGADGAADAGDGSGGTDAEGGLVCDGGGQIVCNGACVDASDPSHCGSCTNVCPGPATGTGTGQAVCTLGADGGGVCSVQCGGTTSEQCGDSCFDPHDVNHCGSCTTACPGPSNGNGMATCTGTMPTCGIACSAGYHVCGGACLPDSDEPSGDACVISEAFGVFVSPKGSDSNPGTMASPVQTVGHAMDVAKAAGKRVYACGSAGSYDEHLVVGSSRDGVSVYGGFDCTTSPSQWTYVASDKAVVAPSTQGYALEVSGLASGVKFEDFGFTAQSASGYDGTGAGASSIAAWVSGSSGVQFVRTTFTAGDGAPGKDGGAYTSNHYTGMMNGNGASGLNGAAALACACPDGVTSSTGGSGGNGVTLLAGTSGSAGNGANGAAVPAAAPMTPFDGKGGAGASYDVGPPATYSKCVPGDDGASGAGGLPGAGAGALGILTATSWAPTAGTAGAIGAPGQGGGGGGGSVGLNGQSGAGGGGGGCGGCGGAGGLGGTGGGSSFALVVVSSTVSLQGCTLTTGNGQKGGNGSTGEPGQGGGGGGTIGACSGGGGGPSGGGGGGGGGAGGSSVGVAWTGAASVTIDGAAISANVPSAMYFQGGSAGSGGSGGSGGGPASGGYGGQNGTAGAGGVVFAVKMF
jgi:hypothetical protein